MKTEAWVINASPLILFARLGRLDLFEQLAPAVIVPDTVIKEVAAGASMDMSAAEAVAWASRFRQPDITLPLSVERWDLGPGESQVIAYCLSARRWAVLDDRMARRCVSSLGLLMIGSLGVILRAKEQRVIDAARPLVNKLVAEGMYADDGLIERTLTAIGEERKLSGK